MGCRQPKRADLARTASIYSPSARVDPGIVLEVLAPSLGRKARLELPAVVFGKLDSESVRKPGPSSSSASRSTKDRWKPSSSSSFYGGETDGGNSIGIRVSGPVEFLAEDVGIDFLINEVAGIELQAALQRFEEGVGAANNGRAAIEDQPPARSKPGQALLGNSNREVDAKLSAAMPIEPPIIIDEVGRVSDDDVGIAVNSAENIAVHGLCRRQAIESRVDGAECQRFAVYVGENQLYAFAEEAGCEDPTRTTPASDINERQFCPRRDR